MRESKNIFFQIAFFISALTISSTVSSAKEINVVLDCEVLKHKVTSVFLGEAYEYDNLSSRPVPGSLRYKIEFDDSVNFFHLIGGSEEFRTNVWINAEFIKKTKWDKENFPDSFQLSGGRGYLGLKYISIYDSHKVMYLVRDGRSWSGNVAHVQNEFVFVTSLSCSHAGTGIDQMLDWLVDNGY